MITTARYMLLILFETKKTNTMNKLIRALIAGWGAKKLGGGCIGTIVVFVIIYYLLGYCDRM
jgi:hypothetical protein